MQLFDPRNFFKRWPRFYYFIGTTFGPMMYGGLSANKFLQHYRKKGVILNIGSGPRIISEEVTNIDMYPYAGVKIVADANSIPIEDESVSLIISDTVLEHVPNPIAAVKEMHRLLKQGGLAYVTVPFLYPYHSSPSDFQRWTKIGLNELFCDFDIVEIGVRAGPFSALTAFVNHLLAFLLSFNSRRLAAILVNVVMFVTFPLKLPDILFNNLQMADDLAAVFFCVVRKK